MSAAHDLWAMTACEGDHEVRWSDDQRWWSHRIPTHQEKRYTRLVAGQVQDHEVLVSLAPRRQGQVCESHVLWCMVETGESVLLLHRFPAVPTMLLQAGETVRHLAVWWLTRPLRHEQALRANMRLAHALRAPKKHGRLETLLPAPESLIRPGVRWDVKRLQPDMYPVSLTRSLKDPPEPRWRKAA